MTVLFTILTWSALATAMCGPQLDLVPTTNLPWISEVLDPRRPPRDVRRRLAALGVLGRVSPLDRTLLGHVASRELAWRVDDRWILFRDSPRRPRLLTADLEDEVHDRRVVDELVRRVDLLQVTTVDAETITVGASIHRVATSDRARRRVYVDGRPHHRSAVATLGYDDAPADVAALLSALGVLESYDAETSRRTLRVPRFPRWSKRLRRMGREFTDLHFSELRLRAEPDPAPGDVLTYDLERRYVETLATGHVPLILDRWELDRPLRQATAALLLPSATRRWFQAVAARLLDLDARAQANQAYTVARLRTRLMRQFEGVLDLASLVLEGRLATSEEFLNVSRFVWPTLGPAARVMPARFLDQDLDLLARKLNAGMMPETDLALEDTDRANLMQLHRALRDRRTRAFAFAHKQPPESP